MAGFTRRTYLRRYLEAPIEFRGPGQADGQHALVSDCCRGGMNFISDRYLAPGAIIFFDPCDLLDAYGHDRCETGYRARVVWCRRYAGDGHPKFSIGVKFTPQDHHARGSGH